MSGSTQERLANAEHNIALLNRAQQGAANAIVGAIREITELRKRVAALEKKPQVSLVGPGSEN